MRVAAGSIVFLWGVCGQSGPAPPGFDRTRTRHGEEPPSLLKSNILERLEDVVIRFAGDSGDGMQLTGSQFTNTSARRIACFL